MKLHSLLFLLLVVGSACETVVDVDIPKENPRLVVNAFISPGQDVGIRITKSKSVLDQAESFPLVTGAQVTLFENGQEVTQLVDETAGWYTAPFRPEPGRRYSVQASAEGAEAVEASSSIAAPVLIRQLTADTLQIESGVTCINEDCEPTYSQEYRLQLQLSDPGDAVNYYEIVAYAVTLDSLPQYDRMGNFVGYDTLRQRQRVSFQTDDPVVNNSFSSVVGDEFYGSSLLFNDDLFSGEGYTVDFTTNNVSGYSTGSILKKLTVELRTLSEDQYQYLRTRDLQEFNNGDLFSEVVPVYSNVENGFGIFAGYSADSVVVAAEE